jgi:hypothetical protein
MWSLIKPWRAWVMRDNWLSTTPGVQVRSIVHRHTLGGLTFDNEAIPWNAGSVEVEAIIRCGPRWRPQQTDLILRLDSGDSFTAIEFKPEEGSNSFRVRFRVPVPRRVAAAQLFLRQWSLGQITLPLLTRQQFLTAVESASPAVHVLLGSQYVSCRSFVATQIRGVLASVVLRSRYSLLPLLSQNLRLEVFDENGKLVCENAPALTASQLAGKETVVLATPDFPRRKGTFRLDWLLNKECICSHEVHALSLPGFLSQVQVRDMRFVVQSQAGDSQWFRNVPSIGANDRAGPGFTVQSGIRGGAGLVRIRIVAAGKANAAAHTLASDLRLVTDGATTVVPGSYNSKDLAQIQRFELRIGRKCLAILQTQPTPHARFDREGAFEETEAFCWDARAEEELNERLNALLKLGDSGMTTTPSSSE